MNFLPGQPARANLALPSNHHNARCFTRLTNPSFFAMLMKMKGNP
jgi:hypothetical protein